MVVAVLHALADGGQLDPGTVGEAIDRYGIDPDTADPWAA